MKALVAIRPEPGLAATIAAGAEAGLEIVGFPLFEIRKVDWKAPTIDSIDGILLGSANALRQGGEGVAALLDKPAYCVGETTAAAARDAGFKIAAVGRGGLQTLLDTLVGKDLRLLRLCGAEHVPIDPSPGIEIETRIVYESVALPMPEELADILRSGALVLAHSAVAVKHLAEECDRQGIMRSHISLAVLAPRIAEAAGEGWAEVRAASEPREVSLLALAGDMCH